MRSRSSTGRWPRAVVAAWVLAVAVIAALIVAVWSHLSASASGASESRMQMSGHAVADALTRAGGHPAGPLLGRSLVTAWQLDAVALALVVVLAAAYLTGLGLRRTRSSGTRWPMRRTASFLAGLAVVAFATSGSIAVYDQVLFTAHMAGHLALVMLAPVLLIAGHPLTLAIESAPPQRRARLERIANGRVVGLLTAPPVALASYAVVIVGSHLTGLMDVIMRNTWVGQLEHLVYLLAGIQFFVLVVGHEPVRWRLGAPARWLLLAVAMAVDTFTGVVLLQGTSPVAVVPSSQVAVDALSDTRTGGALMWVGGDGLMAAVMIALVVTWLRDAGSTERSGWLEQARRSAFESRTHESSASSSIENLDEDESARADYNAWLADLDQRR